MHGHGIGHVNQYIQLCGPVWVPKHRLLAGYVLDGHLAQSSFRWQLPYEQHSFAVLVKLFWCSLTSMLEFYLLSCCRRIRGARCFRWSQLPQHGKCKHAALNLYSQQSACRTCVLCLLATILRFLQVLPIYHWSGSHLFHWGSCMSWQCIAARG